MMNYMMSVLLVEIGQLSGILYGLSNIYNYSYVKIHREWDPMIFNNLINFLIDEHYLWWTLVKI